MSPLNSLYKELKRKHGLNMINIRQQTNKILTNSL